MRKHDQVRATYLPAESRDPLLRYVYDPPIDSLRASAPAIAAVTGHYLEHRFDLLGSGWVVVRYGMDCAGVEGHRYPSGARIDDQPGGSWFADRVTPPNVAESRRIWGLVTHGYQPIDWHLDFKSGWRWSERTWYADVKYGNMPGTDVKVPWELARMQHLPQLALAAILARSGAAAFEAPERYRREFRDQILDFIATNPPRYGVNWRTTMEVAIRVANWLVAYDLFRACGPPFDEAFEEVFRRSVVEHGRHIVTNLEWHPRVSGNHYLADVVGLLFVAAYLPRDADTDAWLAFAVQEVVAEATNQFLDDGAHFEASTCYHRLAGELIVYAGAMILGLSDDKLAALRDFDCGRISSPPGLSLAPMPLARLADGRLTPLSETFLERLERMAEFIIDVTKPNGHIAQIGDNDSGRFLKLVPLVRPQSVAEMVRRYANLDGYVALPGDATYWEEDHLDQRQLIGAVSGVLARPDFARFAEGAEFEAAFTRALSRGVAQQTYRARAPSRASAVRIGNEGELDDIETWLDRLPSERRRVLAIDFPGGGARHGLTQLAYPDFGLYLFRSRRVYMAVRCRSVRPHMPTGHAHNDQLAIELSVDGLDWIRDPGTYVYTPLPHRRNEYRSALAHFTPRVAGPEPARLDLSVFELGRGSEATCLYWGPEGFAGRLRWSDGSVICRVTLSEDRAVITHGIEGHSLEAPGTGDDWHAFLPSLAFSPGYGIVERRS